MKYLCMVLCCAFLSACVQQPQSPEQMASLVVLQQSAPLQLQNVPSAEKKVALIAMKQGDKYAPLEQALTKAAQAASLEPTPSPSLAGYVVLASVMYAGPLSDVAAKAAAQEKYGSSYAPHNIVMEEDEMPEGMGLALVVDVQVAVRQKAKRMRNNTPVVGTASLNTVVDENVSRLVLHLPLSSYPKPEEKAQMEQVLLERAAKVILQAL